MGRILVVLGVVLVVIGLAWPWLQKLPFGRLPGDILIKREGFQFLLPADDLHPDQHRHYPDLVAVQKITAERARCLSDGGFRRIRLVSGSRRCRRRRRRCACGSIRSFRRRRRTR